MAAKTPANVQFTTNDNQQVFFCTLTSVTDGDTFIVPGIAGISSIVLTPSTATAVGFTAAYTSGILTITVKIGTGTPNLTVEAKGLI